MKDRAHPERVVVHVAPDGMAAWAVVTAGPAAGRAEVDAALVQAGVCFGIDDTARETLATALADSTLASPRFDLAFGQSVTPGRDGFFEPAFHVGIQPGHVGPDGKMDFYDRELLKPAVMGQIIGHVRAPRDGSAGTRVTGERVEPAAVHEAVLRSVEGVAVEGDGTVRATRGGVIVYVEGKSLGVASHLVHDGNVDLASGSLEAGGSLTVRGDVQRSFMVHAGGDLVVQGSVDGGSLAAEGNVHVSGGILGGGAGAITAEGNVVARHADRATLKAGGGLTLESATHCEASAAWVEIARIRGGRMRVQRSIVAHDAGAPRGGTSTELTAAVPPATLDDVVRTAAVQKERRLLERQAGRDAVRAKGGKLGLDAVARQKADLEQKLLRAQSRADLVARAFVEVGGTAFAGTLITIGAHRLLLEHDTAAVRFSVDSELGRIRQSPKP